MRRTLLLCFIHGFKGGADTFGAHSQFSQELRQRVAHALPRVDVRVAVYPTYETRGDLGACVVRFIEWLQEQVIDIEVAAKTHSPTVDPSVHCILIGHSMGGIVAADALLSLVGDKRIGDEEEEEETEEETGPEKKLEKKPEHEFTTLMFPYIQGVLGFDTPYLGIAPGVVAHGAEGQYAAATAALAEISGLTEALWGKSKGSAAAGKAPVAALPSSETKKKEAEKGAAAAASSSSASGGGWGWGKIAMVAGAGALASGAAAVAATTAYRNREQITTGWSWATSHLEFVGCLAKGEVLRSRILRVMAVHDQLGVGFGNLYTRLGKTAQEADRKRQKLPVTAFLGDRTFCNLPQRDHSGEWREAVNDAATDETRAHMSMFDPKENPNYGSLLKDARDMIVEWTAGTEWYESSTANRTPLQVMQG